MSIVVSRDDVELNKSCTWNKISSTESHHNHNIILVDEHYRWEQTIHDPIDLNKKWEEWSKLGLTKNSEIVREYYRSIGYSLYGYWEIFYWEVNNPDFDKYVPNRV